MRPAIRIVTGVAILGLLLSACSSSTSKGTSRFPDTGPASVSGLTPTTNALSSPSSIAAPKFQSSGDSLGQPPNLDPPVEYNAAVEASISPNCVLPTGKITLQVHVANEKSSAGYLAYYAHGTGAPAPWGQGYGGNDSGLTDENGTWTSTWTVSPNAPTGPGHVDVYVGVRGQGFGFKSLPFRVASPATRC